MSQVKRSVFNPFASPDSISGYEAWYETTGRQADGLEKTLLKQLAARFPEASSLLEIGCGTGHFTRWFQELGLETAGIDLSIPMLAQAIHLGSLPAVHSDAMALPFCTGAFDLVALITTLEFVADPIQALGEALRVCQQGLILGVLNRRSLLGWQLRNKGGPIWNSARFFAPAELTRLVRYAAAGRRVKVVWRTTLWPGCLRALPLPWGGFIGMAVILPE